MKPIFLFLIALLVFASACRKMDLRPKEMNCEITGELLVWESEKKVKIDPDAPPTIMVMEQKYYKPWSPYREPIYKTLVNKDGTFTINVELEKEGEYYLELAGFDVYGYYDMAPSSRVLYKKKQVLDYRLVAKSWVTPRFINQVNLPGDTFTYVYGIGSPQGSLPVFVGATDTIMPWVHSTWGGSLLDKSRHWVKANLTRDGVTRDTSIYYFVPPGDTSIVEIRY
jgi:hypothetical protein